MDLRYPFIPAVPQSAPYGQTQFHYRKFYGVFQPFLASPFKNRQNTDQHLFPMAESINISQNLPPSIGE